MYSHAKDKKKSIKTIRGQAFYTFYLVTDNFVCRNLDSIGNFGYKYFDLNLKNIEVLNKLTHYKKMLMILNGFLNYPV